MKTATSCTRVDYRLLAFITDLVICSRCLRSGEVTPVPQVVSPRHRLRSLCNSCAQPKQRAARQNLVKLTHS
jgi:hypothetical protein